MLCNRDSNKLETKKAELSSNDCLERGLESEVRLGYRWLHTKVATFFDRTKNEKSIPNHRASQLGNLQEEPEYTWNFLNRLYEPDVD